MSPTVFIKRGYRFFFFSREESRMHVHVICDEGEAKFWLKPKVELSYQHKLNFVRINEIRKIIEENYDELKSAWSKHFRS